MRVGETTMKNQKAHFKPQAVGLLHSCADVESGRGPRSGVQPFVFGCTIYSQLLCLSSCSGGFLKSRGPSPSPVLPRRAVPPFPISVQILA